LVPSTTCHLRCTEAAFACFVVKCNLLILLYFLFINYRQPGRPASCGDAKVGETPLKKDKLEEKFLPHPYNSLIFNKNIDEIFSFRTSKVRTLEVRTLEVRTLAVRTLEVRTLEVRTLEVRTLEVRTLEVL
jgi:hypothetical protein